MRISVIIPAYNCAEYLKRAVDSLLQTGYSPLEIVIVEDGSNDRTLTVATDLAREHPQVVRLLRHPGGKNGGVSKTRNLGIHESSGELLAFLDADDYVQAWRFDSAVEILSNRPEIDGVYQTTAMRFIDDEERHNWWSGDESLFGINSPLSNGPLLDSLLNASSWHTSAIVFRRTLLKKTGAFHEGMRIAEDCHLWLRMAYVGRIEPGDLSRPVSTYFRHPGSAYQASTTQRLHVVRALCDFYRWTANINPQDPRRTVITTRISDYILRGIEEARKVRHQSLAWALAIKGALRFPRLCLERRWYGNIARMVLGR